MFSWLLSVGGVDSLLFESDSGSENLQNYFKDFFFGLQKKEYKHFTFVSISF